VKTTQATGALAMQQRVYTVFDRKRGRNCTEQTNNEIFILKFYIQEKYLDRHIF
jgi:hypothetical protein